MFSNRVSSTNFVLGGTHNDTSMMYLSEYRQFFKTFGCSNSNMPKFMANTGIFGDYLDAMLLKYDGKSFYVKFI